MLFGLCAKIGVANRFALWSKDHTETGETAPTNKEKTMKLFYPFVTDTLHAILAGIGMFTLFALFCLYNATWINEGCIYWDYIGPNGYVLCPF